MQHFPTKYNGKVAYAVLHDAHGYVIVDRPDGNVIAKWDAQQKKYVNHTIHAGGGANSNVSNTQESSASAKTGAQTS